MYVEQHTKRQVYKNAKPHNVYHRCLCFIFDQTTMGQGSGNYLSPGGGGRAEDLGLYKVEFSRSPH